MCVISVVVTVAVKIGYIKDIKIILSNISNNFTFYNLSGEVVQWCLTLKPHGLWPTNSSSWVAEQEYWVVAISFTGGSSRPRGQTPGLPYCSQALCWL